jgi:sugar phosphate permease
MAAVPADFDKPRPTRVRYLIVFVTTLTAVMLYLHRFCFGFAAGYIQDDLGLSTGQVGVLFSVFLFAYGAGQVPAGWFGDRWGARAALALYVFTWSLFTGLMGAAAGFVAVVLLRAGCGLAQAGAYPVSASLLSRWVPFPARGLASAVVSVGGRLGGAVAPVLTAYLLVAFVPSDAPALLEPGDLFDVPGLCRRIAEPGEGDTTYVGCCLFGRSPAVRDLAGLEPGEVPSPGQVAALVADLNEAIDDPTLWEASDTRELPVEAEARRLAARPRSELTEAQAQRLNRLVLEAAYPGHVKKLYVAGWRPVMWVYGAAGIFVAALFWLAFRNRPEQHPWANAAEVALIESSRPPTVSSPQGRAGALPLGAILRHRSLWLSSLSQFMTNFGWIFIGFWLPRYLADVHQVPAVERGWMAGVPMGVGMVGMLAGGWVTDRLTRALGLRWGRGLPMSLTRFAAMAAFAACALRPSPWLAVAELACVTVAVDLGTASVWAFMQDVGGRYVGSVLGWGNMWGAVGAAVSPLVISAEISHPALGWEAAFLTCAAAFLVSGLAALGVDARERLAA